MNIDPVKVSIIVPVYNVERYLQQCIDSILHQSYENIEIILVNDGSIDRSGYICEEYKKSDSRIKIYHKKNSGAADSRKFGVNQSTGEWIMFVDSDDTLPTDAVEKLIKLNENNKYDILVGTVSINGKIFQHQINGEISAANYVSALLKFQTNIGPFAKLFKRSLFDKINWSTPKYVIQNEDLYMLVLLALESVNIYVSSHTVAYNYLWRPGSASSKVMCVEGWTYLFESFYNLFLKRSDCERAKLFDALQHYILFVMLYNCIYKGIYVHYPSFMLEKGIPPLSITNKMKLFFYKFTCIQKILYKKQILYFNIIKFIKHKK